MSRPRRIPNVKAHIKPADIEGRNIPMSEREQIPADVEPPRP